MPDTSKSLKRKGSTIDGSTGVKQSRKAVQSFVLKPKEVDLRVPGALTVEKLRVAMELDMSQFKEVTGQLRTLAKEKLDVDLVLASQNKEKWDKFVAEACEQQPLLRTKYAEAWPIEVYMNLYLYNRAAVGRKLPSSASSLSKQHMSSADHRKLSSSALLNFIPRPPNEAQLSHVWKTRMDDLRIAMGFDCEDFRQLRSSIRGLAVKHLDINVMMDDQPQAKWEAFEQEVLEAEPLLSTKFEGAWPLRVYMNRYLTKRLSRPSADNQHPDQTLPGENSLENAVTALPSEVPCEAEAMDTTSPSPSPTASVFSSSDITASSDNTKVVLPEVQTPAASVEPDYSTPVVQFLRSLDPNLEHLLDLFVTLGIRDGQTLATFKRLSNENRRSLLRGRLNELQLLGMDIYFGDA